MPRPSRPDHQTTRPHGFHGQTRFPAQTPALTLLRAAAQTAVLAQRGAEGKDDGLGEEWIYDGSKYWNQIDGAPSPPPRSFLVPVSPLAPSSCLPRACVPPSLLPRACAQTSLLPRACAPAPIARARHACSHVPAPAGPCLSSAMGCSRWAGAHTCLRVRLHRARQPLAPMRAGVGGGVAAASSRERARRFPRVGGGSRSGAWRGVLTLK